MGHSAIQLPQTLQRTYESGAKRARARIFGSLGLMGKPSFSGPSVDSCCGFWELRSTVQISGYQRIRAFDPGLKGGAGCSRTLNLPRMRPMPHCLPEAFCNSSLGLSPLTLFTQSPLLALRRGARILKSGMSCLSIPAGVDKKQPPKVS